MKAEWITIHYFSRYFCCSNEWWLWLRLKSHSKNGTQNALIRERFDCVMLVPNGMRTLPDVIEPTGFFSSLIPSDYSNTTKGRTLSNKYAFVSCMFARNFFNSYPAILLPFNETLQLCLCDQEMKWKSTQIAALNIVFILFFLFTLQFL